MELSTAFNLYIYICFLSFLLEYKVFKLATLDCMKEYSKPELIISTFFAFLMMPFIVLSFYFYFYILGGEKHD